MSVIAIRLKQLILPAILRDAPAADTFLITPDLRWRNWSNSIRDQPSTIPGSRNCQYGRKRGSEELAKCSPQKNPVPYSMWEPGSVNFLRLHATRTAKF